VTPVDTRAALLCAECRRDWGLVKTHLSRVRAADLGRGDAEAALVALSLDHAYQAFETILARCRGSAPGCRPSPDAASPVERVRPNCRRS